MAVLSKGVWAIVLVLAVAVVVASSEGGNDGSDTGQSPDTDFALVSVSMPEVLG